MKYLLVILAKSDKQDEFVNFIANELTTLCQNNQVKFFYTQESIFFSFETDIDVSGLEGIIFDMFNHMDLIYFLSEYTPDKMFTNMSEKTTKYLFEDTTLFDKFKSTESLVEKLDDIDNEILEKLTFLKEKIEDFSKEKLEKNKLSLNEILDKINTNGINNLTKEELTLLDEYSKSI